MNREQVTARLKELDRAHNGRHPLWTKTRVMDLIKETERLRLTEPSAIFAEPGDYLEVVWQGAEGCVTVYVDDYLYAIEVVPNGPSLPFTATEASIAGAYLAGLFINFGPLDAS